uniref:Uncharacterized protein n=1 Tax=Anopheles melas TaxID=34690 RepID=A0A182TG23_9DIPT
MNKFPVRVQQGGRDAVPVGQHGQQEVLRDVRHDQPHRPVVVRAGRDQGETGGIQQQHDGRRVLADVAPVQIAQHVAHAVRDQGGERQGVPEPGPVRQGRAKRLLRLEVELRVQQRQGADPGDQCRLVVQQPQHFAGLRMAVAHDAERTVRQQAPQHQPDGRRPAGRPGRAGQVLERPAGNGRKHHVPETRGNAGQLAHRGSARVYLK